MLCRLDEMKRGEAGCVKALDTQQVEGMCVPPAELECRLIEMGFVEKASLVVMHEAPFGHDPIAVKIHDTMVALRRCEARAVLVERQGL